MHQPAHLPNEVGMGHTNAEIIHLLGLGDRLHTRHGADGAVRLLERIAHLQVTGTHPAVT